MGTGIRNDNYDSNLLIAMNTLDHIYYASSSYHLWIPFYIGPAIKLSMMAYQILGELKTNYKIKLKTFLS